MWDNIVKNVLNVRKLSKRSAASERTMTNMFWKWENYVRGALNKKKLCKRCNESEKNM